MLKNIELKTQIRQFVDKIELANSIHEIQNIKKLKGYKAYYRYRVGNYRVGFKVIDASTIKLITIAKRNDKYKLFPFFLT
ncbi:MAG: plasmid stabilization protein [Bacteroidetes bacterium]|nr:MAG: plasmid stabilization protein [Bacteroidota bacterium]MBL1145549.1 plasmid stabilization protein [Bacteroidota bacterium]